MNQILQTKLKKHLKKIKNILKIQFYISIFLIIIISLINIFYLYNLYKKEKYADEILNTYNITKLYSNIHIDINNDSDIIGIIEIPSINIHYPLFSGCTEELLKISPCRLYGPLPGKIGNLCIAGHNYDNNKFFSKIPTLNINDEIILYNNYNKKFSYFIFDIYEVKYDDMSPIYSYDKKSRQLTLITCNNINNKRIIIKALCYS